MLLLLSERMLHALLGLGAFLILASDVVIEHHRTSSNIIATMLKPMPRRMPLIATPNRLPCDRVIAVRD
jgi:hypothetical protein